MKGHRDYWKNNKDDINARRRARTANLTKAGLKERREKDREYREAHREIINARRRARRASLSKAELEVVREKDRARRRHAQKRKGDKYCTPCSCGMICLYCIPTPMPRYWRTSLVLNAHLPITTSSRSTLLAIWFTLLITSSNCYIET